MPIAVTEMKHAEAITERLAYLGGTPTTKPEPVFVGELGRSAATEAAAARRRTGHARRRVDVAAFAQA
jgi:bacterioferritin (cytochrome b1)